MPKRSKKNKNESESMDENDTAIIDETVEEEHETVVAEKETKKVKEIPAAKPSKSDPQVDATRLYLKEIGFSYC